MRQISRRKITHEARARFAVHVTRFGRRLCRGRDLEIGRAPLNCIAGCRLHAVVTLVRGEQPGSGTNLDLLQTCRLFNFARRIFVERRIYDVNPNRQGEFSSERATIDLLRLVEACPNCASKIRIVSGKKCISKIVGGAGLARCWQLFQTELRVCGFSCSRLERIDKTGMHFVGGFGFDDCLPGTIALRVPYQCSVLFLDALQNVRCIWPPAAVWEYRVSQRELSERNLAAAEKRGRIWPKRRTNPSRRTKLQDRIDARVHADADSCAIL